MSSNYTDPYTPKQHCRSEKSDIVQRRMQNPVKHLRWNVLQK